MSGQEMDPETIRDFLDCRVFAVVGVSTNREKYGYRVFEDLKEGGYTVYAVNPRYDEIFSEPCYPDLKSLPEQPEVVDFVCPPGVTESFVKEMSELGMGRAWMQPGAESQEAIDYCRVNGIAVLHDICVMVQRKKA